MKGFLLFLVVIVALGAWCPWYDEATAEKLIAEETAEVDTLNRYCTLTPNPKTIHKVLFGYGEEVAYDCAIIEGESITQGKNIVVAAFFGMVFNMPQPTFK